MEVCWHDMKCLWQKKKVPTVRFLPPWLSLTLGTLCLMLAPKGRATSNISPNNGSGGRDSALILFPLAP